MSPLKAKFPLAGHRSQRFGIKGFNMPLLAGRWKGGPSQKECGWALGGLRETNKETWDLTVTTKRNSILSTT